MPDSAKLFPMGSNLLTEYLNRFSFQGVSWGNSFLN